MIAQDIAAKYFSENGDVKIMHRQVINIVNFVLQLKEEETSKLLQWLQDLKNNSFALSNEIESLKQDLAQERRRILPRIFGR